MKQLLKRSRTIKPRKASMFMVRSILILVTLAFAAFTIINYALTFWETSQGLAIFIGVVFGLSALVTPFLTPVLVHARGVWIFAGLAILAVFMTIDGFGFSQAFTTLERQLTEKAYSADLEAWERDTADTRNRLTAVQNARDAIVLPKRDCLCPQTKAADLAQYEAEVTIADLQIEKLEADLLAKPVRADIIDNRLVMGFSMVLQIVLALAFAFVEAVREAKFKREITAYEAKRQKPKAKAPAKREEFGGLFAIEGGKA